MADACFSITCQVGLLSLGFCQKITAGKYEVVSRAWREGSLEYHGADSIVNPNIQKILQKELNREEI